MDLSELTQAALEEFKASGKIEKMINEQLDATVRSAIKSALGYKFEENLRKALSEELHVNLDHLGFGGYNQMVLGIVKKNVDQYMREDMGKRLDEAMKEILSNPPSEIRISEIIDAFVDECMKYNDEEDVCKDDIRERLIIEENDHGSYYDISIKDPDRNTWGRADLFIHVSHLQDDNVHIIGIRVGGKNLEKDLFVGPLYGLDRLLFAAWHGGAKIILDGEGAE